MQTLLLSNPPQIKPTEDELRELEHKTKILVASINKLNVNTKRYLKHALNAQQLGELLADCNISFSFLCYLLDCFSSWQFTLLQNLIGLNVVTKILLLTNIGYLLKFKILLNI